MARTWATKSSGKGNLRYVLEISRANVNEARYGEKENFNLFQGCFYFKLLTEPQGGRRYAVCDFRMKEGLPWPPLFLDVSCILDDWAASVVRCLPSQRGQRLWVSWPRTHWHLEPLLASCKVSHTRVSILGPKILNGVVSPCVLFFFILKWGWRWVAILGYLSWSWVWASWKIWVWSWSLSHHWDFRKRWGRKHCYMWMMENMQGIRTELRKIFVFNQKKRNVIDWVFVLPTLAPKFICWKVYLPLCWYLKMGPLRVELSWWC